MEGEAVEAEAEGRDKRQSKMAESVEGTTSTSFPIVIEVVSSNTRPALQDALLKICTLSRQVTWS